MDPTMSYSTFDSSMDSVAQWIDTGLISDSSLLHLMEYPNSLPLNAFEFASSSSLAEDTYPSTTNGARTNNFELANGFGNVYALTEAQIRSSIVKSEATSGSFSTLEHPSQVQERPVLDEVAKLRKERRRAQNRKAQQAFRQRKDTAIARLEREMEKLKSINHELSQTNRIRLQEILELKARLGALRLSLSPSTEGQDTEEEKKAELPLPFWVQSPSTEEPITANTVPWIKWRGRLYIDNEAMATSSTENGRLSFVDSSIGALQGDADEI